MREDQYTLEWAKSLGLLPVPLFVNGSLARSVLLNGSSGNFCLDSTRGEHSDRRAAAWSANVGHYIRIARNRVEIQRWDASRSDVEMIPLASVTGDLERFHHYLVRSEPPLQRAVVPHVIRVFRQIRNRPELSTGSDSLKVLLYLLASAATMGDQKVLDASQWILPDGAEELAKIISPEEWGLLQSDLMNPTDSDLVLNVDLLIRHAAGPVFQEAHRQAALNDAAQMPLPGFTKREAVVTNLELGVGVHFTPPPLARTVVEQALAALGSRAEFNVFDPACGSGEFLREALRQIRLSGFNGAVSLTGWDISTAACDMAKFLLSWEKIFDGGEVRVNVDKKDSLRESWPNSTNLLLMNPPFVSYEQLTPEQRDAVREVMGSLAVGRTEYSNAFVYKAVESLQKNAVLGAIVPSSFYESDAASGLRNSIKQQISPWLLARLGSQVLFPDAIVDAGLLVGRRNGASSDDLLAFWADEHSESTAEGLRHLRKVTSSQVSRRSIAVVHDGFSIYSAPELFQRDKSWSPRRYSSWVFANKLRHLPMAGDLFSIHTGARSGLLKAFLLPKEKWSRLPKQEQIFFRPAVVNEAIEAGRLTDSVYVFYPHGALALPSERELKERIPKFYQGHLSSYRALLEKRGSTPSVREKWWEMHRPRSWQQTRSPKLVSVQYGDVGAFGWDGRGDFVVVGGYGWLPRAPLKITGRFPVKLGLAYLALLNSPTFFELVASNSRKVRGGQWDLGNKYLERVPLPDLTTATGSPIFDSLFRFGSELQSRGEVDWIELTKVAKSIYGV